MKENITLKFPSGEFTHSELAATNGKTNQQVWTAYQAAIKAGVIVFVGAKSGGKGKPSKYWKVADGQPVPLVDKVEVVKVPEVLNHRGPKAVKVKTAIVSSLLPVAPVILAIIAETDKALPSVVPTTSPVDKPFEVEFNTPPEIVGGETIVENIQPVVQPLTCQVIEIEETCPFCHTKLLSVNNNGSVKVWCQVNDYKICSCSENPYGVSNNVKNAVEILHDKFKHR